MTNLADKYKRQQKSICPFKNKAKTTKAKLTTYRVILSNKYKQTTHNFICVCVPHMSLMKSSHQ